MATALPPSLADIDRLAQATIAALDPAFQTHAKTVALRIVDWPDDDMLAVLGLDDAYELTGLYEGTPLTEKSVMDPGQGPDVIWLFRRPILDEWADRGDIPFDHMIAHILIHELAHHFGWSDADIAAIDPWWEA